MPRHLFAITTLLLLGAGCTTVSPVGLRHPQSGHAVRCEGYWYWNIDTRGAQAQELRQRQCVEDYERQGYRRIR